MKALVLSTAYFLMSAFTAFSQEKYKILFTSKRNGIEALYTMRADGQHETQLTHTIQGCAYAAMSPDKRYIIFLRGDDKNKPVYANPTLDIYRINADGSNEFRLTNNNVLEYTLTWSRDSRYIYFTRKGKHEQMFRMDADGSNEVAISDTSAANVRPVFSEDGKYIAFHTYRHGNDNPELYIMKADGTEQRRVTNSPGWDYNISFSPDGKSFVFSSNRHGGSAEVYTMQLDGSNVKRLTFMNQDSWALGFSPDGKLILFQSGTNKYAQLYTMNSDGSDIKPVGPKEYSNYLGSWYTE